MHPINTVEAVSPIVHQLPIHEVLDGRDSGGREGGMGWQAQRMIWSTGRKGRGGGGEKGGEEGKGGGRRGGGGEKGARESLV